ncbi:MAG TPA: DUF308 domain-containing protein [Parafilimonas sp.]|nr:DUF308 domain-containing protein [Parafilimonas sp.]
MNTIKNGIKNWWWFLIMGIASLVAGAAIFAKPAESYITLSVLFSIIMASTGFSQIVFSISERRYLKNWGWTLVSGILDFALGTYLMIYPAITMATLPFIVGFYLLFRAIYLIGASIELSSIGIKGWGWLLTGGVVLLALGFLTLYYPAVGAIGIVACSGYAFIVSGIFSIVLAFQLKSFKARIPHFENDLQKSLGIVL